MHTLRADTTAPPGNSCPHKRLIIFRQLHVFGALELCHPFCAAGTNSSRCLPGQQASGVCGLQSHEFDTYYTLSNKLSIKKKKKRRSSSQHNSVWTSTATAHVCSWPAALKDAPHVGPIQVFLGVCNKELAQSPIRGV